MKGAAGGGRGDAPGDRFRGPGGPGPLRGPGSGTARPGGGSPREPLAATGGPAGPGGSPGGPSHATGTADGGVGGGGAARGGGGDEDDRDPGLQPERTRLAWRRTTLSCAVTAVLAGRQVLRGGGRAVSVLAVCLAALAFLVFLRLAHRRIQQLGRAPRPPLMSSRAATAVAGCTVALALFGAALVW